MRSLSQIRRSLREHSSAEKAAFFPRFFKTGKGDYGEGDKFLGVTVPNQRAIAKTYWRDADQKDIEALLDSPYHEERLTGLIILVSKFNDSFKKGMAKPWVDLYLRKLDRVNNWDLVDSSAPQILGKWLFDKDRKLLYKFAADSSLWKNRVAMLSTQYFIRNGDLDDMEKLVRLFLSHPHDLMHKAVGWMLREAWQKDPQRIANLLKEIKDKLPRTALRYAIEKMGDRKRKKFLR